MNRVCNVTKRIRTDKGPRYCAVVFSANGRIKPDVVIVNGKEERHPEGAYDLEGRAATKRGRVSVGTTTHPIGNHEESVGAKMLCPTRFQQVNQ